MRSFWSEPFLWIHLAGIGVFPFCLATLCLALAMGQPILPVWVELCLIGLVGIVPVLWMQLVRPFSIFCLLVVALKPEKLTTKQRQILSLFKIPTNQLLAILTAALMVGLLWQVYQFVPVAATVASFLPEWRLLGLLLAGVAFLVSNLFLQVPVSVAGVLLRSDATVAATQPYPLDKIGHDFTILGFQVSKILPAMIDKATQASVSVTSPIEVSSTEDRASSQ